MTILDRMRRLPGIVSVILISCAIILSFFIFFPQPTLLVARGLGGIIAWVVGLIFGRWQVFLRFLLSLLVALMVLTVWCGSRAWLQVRWINPDHPWECPGAFRIILSSSVTVLFAVLTELVLPLFLLLSLVLLIGSIARLLLSDEWSQVSQALGNILTGFIESPWLTSDDLASLVDRIDVDGARIMAALSAKAQAGSALIGGTLSTVATLLVFLFRRRTNNLDAARIVSAEIETTCRMSLQTVPQALVNAEGLLNLPRGQLLIAVGSDRELLLLDPGAGHAAKLPACLLESVVEFFHADLALAQAYSAFGSVAFAKAARDRRERYLAGFTGIWRQVYQTAAFTALFRLALYARLRAWSI